MRIETMHFNRFLQTLWFAFEIMAFVSCSNKQQLTPLQERCDSLTKPIVYEDELADMIVVKIMDTVGNYLVDTVYAVDKGNRNNKSLKIELNELLFPIFLCITNNYDSTLTLPAGVRNFYGMDVVDGCFGGKTLSLRDALERRSHVAFVHLIDSVYGHQRGELLNRISDLVDIEMPCIVNDSSFINFCQGKRVYGQIDALLGFYREHVINTPIQTLMPNGISSIHCFQDKIGNRIVDLCYVGFYENIVGLIVIINSRTHGRRTEELWNELFKKKSY